MRWYEIALVVLVILLVLVALLVAYARLSGGRAGGAVGGGDCAGGNDYNDFDDFDGYDGHDGYDDYGADMPEINDFADLTDVEGYPGDELGGDGSGIDGGGRFRLKIRDPWYTKMLLGEKRVEARLDKRPFDRLKAGDEITVVRSRPKGDTSEYKGGRYKYDTTVKRVTKFANIGALLKKEEVQKVFPGAKKPADAVAAFAEFAGEGGTEKPVLAIEVAPPKK